MIFGKEYDVSLSYMLKVRNLYRKKIINFIKELPEELLENIRTCYVNTPGQNAGEKEEDNPFYNIKSSEDPNIYYSFFIMCRDLYIKKVQIVNGTRKDLFSIVLVFCDINKIQSEEYKKYYLGSACKGKAGELNFHEVDYDLKNTKYGHMILKTYYTVGGLIQIKLYRPNNINNIPEDISLNNSSEKKLIKIPRLSDNNKKY